MDNKAKDKKIRNLYLMIGGGIALLSVIIVLALVLFLPGSEPADVIDASPDVSADTPVIGMLPDDEIVIDPPPIVLRADSESTDGVSKFTAFIVETNDYYLSRTALIESLSVTPAVPFTIAEKEDGSFAVVPDEPLDDETIYRFDFAGGDDNEPLAMSWAFQTEGELRVVTTLPADSTSDIPLRSGVEITFTNIVNDIEGYFTIEPSVKGRFEYHDKTVVFVPLESFMNDTVYTVTVKAGLASASSELKEDCTFEFRSETEYQSAKVKINIANEFTETFLPSDPLAVQLFSHNDYSYFQNLKFETNIYRLSGEEEYLKLAEEHASHINPYIGKNTDYLLDTTGLTSVASFTEKILKAPNMYGTYYIVPPESPGVGYYIIDMRSSTGGLTLQKLVCISDMAVFAQSAEGQTLFWINDSVSGEALAGAKLTVECGGKRVEAVTDADGIALIDIATESYNGKASVQIRAADGRTYADTIRISSESERPPVYDYMSYLYFDRAAYLPNDTVKFWGVVQTRTKGAALPDELTLEIESLPPVTIKPGKDGTFSGEIKFNDLQSSWYRATLKCERGYLYNNYLVIMDYTKPTYVFEAKYDKTYYRKSDTMNATITANFFDGTPAAGITIRAQNKGYTTDEAGIVNAVISKPVWNSWQPSRTYDTVETNGRENGNAYMYLQTIYFPTDYMMEGSIVDSDGGFRIELKTNKIDFGKVDALISSDYIPKADEMRGAPYSQTVTAVVIKHETIRTKTGTGYDFINKVSYDTYSYDYRESVAGTYQLTTASDGYLLSQLLPFVNSDFIYYDVKLTYTTPDGAALEMYIWKNNYFRYGSDLDYKTYYLNGKRSFVYGEELNFTLTGRTGEVASGGKLLYATYNDKLMDMGISDDLTAQVTCSDEHIPNFTISGAYFDGKHIFTIENYSWYDNYSDIVAYNSKERELTVDVKTDKTAYKPGDTVTVTVKLTDKDGAPQAGSYVLSVVDEAAFAIMDQHVDILSSMYRIVFRPTVTSFASYIQHTLFNTDAEGGGDGDSGGVRKDFVDTAAFITGTTAADGTATFSFKIADNITSWRLTCLAVTDLPHAGYSQTNITTTIPFFINDIVGTKYAAGDEVVMSARGAGTAVKTTDKVSYTASLVGTNEKRTASETSSSYAYFSFGKLPVGDYTVRIEAKFGSYTDIIEKPFSVVDSLLEVQTHTFTDIAGIAGLDIVKYPVGLLFYDKEMNDYMAALARLNSFSGQRGDQLLSLAVARGKYAEFSSDCAWYYGDVNLSGIQSSDGAMRLLSYGSADAILTARMLFAAGEYLDKDAAVAYLYSVVNNRKSSASEVAAAYLGLAAAGEKVLVDVKRLLDSKSSMLSLTDNIYLAIALTLYGDEQTALAWYKQNISPKITRSGETAYLDTDARTAQAAMLALYLDHPDAKALYKYVIYTRTSDYLPSAELMVFVKLYDPPESEQSVFSYKLNGETVTVNLRHTPVYFVSMGREQLEAAEFTQLSGNVSVTADYITGSGGITPDNSEKIKINKKYEMMINSGRGELVRVTITVDFAPGAPNDSYTITDVLPSGVRFSGTKNVNNENWYLKQEDGGRVVFRLDRRKWTWSAEGGFYAPVTSFTIVYYARVALPGTYLTESAVIMHDNSELCVITQRGTYTIEY